MNCPLPGGLMWIIGEEEYCYECFQAFIIAWFINLTKSNLE